MKILIINGPNLNMLGTRETNIYGNETLDDLYCMIEKEFECEFEFFQSNHEGEIIDKYRGDGGFGYDPIFLCSALNKTFAQASSAEKNSVSHRARALSDLKRKLGL